MDQPTARIRRRDLRVLVQATRFGGMPAVPVFHATPETTLPVKPLSLPDRPIPVNPLTVVVAFVVATGVGFLATMPLW